MIILLTFLIILIFVVAGFYFYDPYTFDTVLGGLGFYPLFANLVVSADWVQDPIDATKGCPAKGVGTLYNGPTTLPLKTVSVAVRPEFLGGDAVLSLKISECQTASSEVIVTVVGQPEVDPIKFSTGDTAIKKITNLQVMNKKPIQFMFKNGNVVPDAEGDVITIKIVTFYLIVTNDDGEKALSTEQFLIYYE
jgi:hypothetical protein